MTANQPLKLLTDRQTAEMPLTARIGSALKFVTSGGGLDEVTAEQSNPLEQRGHVWKGTAALSVCGVRS